MIRAMICGVVFGCVSACVAIPLHKVEGKCVELKDFSKAQKNVILKAFKYGLKSGYGYTMAAIAWKESCAGEYKMNFADPSAGIYHAHIPGLLKKTNQKDTGFMRNMVGELLVRDDEYASQVALEELLYWHKVRKGNWQEVIKSYNKGFSWERDSERAKMAQSYYEDIARKVKALQAYMPKYAASLAKQARDDKAIVFLGGGVAGDSVRTGTKRVATKNKPPTPKPISEPKVASKETKAPPPRSSGFMEVPRDFVAPSGADSVGVDSARADSMRVDSVPTAPLPASPRHTPPIKKRNPNTGEFYLLQEN